MAQLWIVPAANDAAFRNIDRSLRNPLSPEIVTQAGLEGTVFAWGNQTQAVPVLERMQQGDVCVFYTKADDGGPNRYCWAGTIHSTRDASQLAERIWADPSFRYIYFLSAVWPIDLSVTAFAHETGSQDHFPLGLQRLNPERTAKLEAAHGTLDLWVRRFERTTTTPPASAAMVPNNVERIVRHISASGFHFAPTTVRAFNASLQAKPFVILAGNSGTGKSRLVRLYADCFGATEQNRGFQMIPVRPDWNDGSELVGYTDLENKFRPGKLVEPLLRAHANPEQAFFVCLDEMNLARVEHYFSDFLSIIESRRKESSGSIVTDAFLRREQIAGLADELLPKDLVDFVQKLKSEKQDLGLPPNLFIVGTVNMDETTQPFSRKVLDRANTLELNSVDLRQGLEPATASDAGGAKLTLKDVAPRFVRLFDLLPEHRTTAERAVVLLEKANSRLAAGGFEVGYRVRDEAAIFLVHAKEAGLTDDEAADCVVMQKILPRIHGSSPRLEKVLEALLTDCLGADAPRKESDDFVAELQTRRADPTLTPVARKLAGMWLLFRDENFTSFWLA